MKTIFFLLVFFANPLFSFCQRFDPTYCTSRIDIERVSKGDTLKGTGTGFYFKFDNGKTYLVTNKHVVKGASKGFVYFTEKEDNKPKHGNTRQIEINNFENWFIAHPDTTLDLCIMPVDSSIFSSDDLKVAYYQSVSFSQIISCDSLGGNYSIMTVGYPKGIWDSYNNLPVMRRGYTAISPKFNYENKPELLLDLQMTHGNSGSPVFLVLGNKLSLMGIIVACYNNNDLGFEIPLNVGTAIKASKLLEFQKVINN